MCEQKRSVAQYNQWCEALILFVSHSIVSQGFPGTPVHVLQTCVPAAK